MTCNSTIGISAPAITYYKIDENGVTVNNEKVYAWVNPQETISLFPLVKDYAKDRE